jgi:predicted ATP-dependent serine protease
VERIKESAKIGLRTAFVPTSVAKELPDKLIREVIKVDHVQGLLAHLK